MVTVDWDMLALKKWILDNYTFFNEIFEHDGMYYLEFCLKEDAVSFIKLCCKHNTPFTFRPPYGVAVKIVHVEMLMKKGEYAGDFKINQQTYFETHPLLKLH